LSTINPGINSIYVRAKDNSGQWGLYTKKTFYVVQGSFNTPNLTQMEYFLDNDPGFGNGTTISITPDSIINISFNVDLSAFSAGIHNIFVRAKDELGMWSPYTKKTIYVIQGSVIKPDIVDIEYYFDIDPGFGNGTSVNFVNDSIIDVSFIADLSTFTPGIHNLYVRSRDAYNQWSLYTKKTIYVVPGSSVIPDIVEIEYFVDNDPGVGNGISVPISEFNDTLDMVFNIEVAGLFTGEHQVYFRAKDANDHWSLYSQDTLNITALNCEYTDVPVGHYAYDAVGYLCSQRLLEDDDTCNPGSTITRAALAKLAYRSINLGAHAYAEVFPTPFNDLQDPDVWYYSFAKNLTYLEFDNKIAPFDKEFFNFYPSRGISRAHTLKVLLETWDVDIQTGTGMPFTDVNTTHDAYEYIYTAYQLGIISDNTEHKFWPDLDIYRGKAFVMLYNIMDILSLAVPTVTEADFFVPGNYTPENFSSFNDMHSGNFNFYTKSSFAISGIGLPLTFEHTYNSYLTEMPNELKPLKPLGEGWSHTFNSCITELQGDADLPEHFRVIVALPGGELNVYRKNGSNYEAVTKGLYNLLAKPDPYTFTLTTKNQIVYTYEKLYGSADKFPYVLTSIRNRNNNTISIAYESSAVSPTDQFRISDVTGTAGRTLDFNYQSGSDLLSDIADPLGRNIIFDYDSYVSGQNNNLTLFKDAKNQSTLYSYGTSQSERNLLLTIQLPKGNTITNIYEGRKLMSSQTNSNNPTEYAYDPNYGQSANNNFTQTITTNPEGEVTVADYNKNGNPNFVNSPAANIDIAYNSSQVTKPENINVNGQVTDFVYDDMGNVLEMDLPLGISHHFQYNTMNDVTQYTNPRGKIFTNTYNSFGNLYHTITPRGTTTYNHNNLGQLLSVVNP
ncbi:MAG: hypothetical protein DRJ05_19430, partial [Bacteroidetes bacterium]